MAEQPCSHCGEPGRLLDDVSAFAQVDYYRCATCGQVWSPDRHAKTPAVKVISAPEQPDRRSKSRLANHANCLIFPWLCITRCRTRSRDHPTARPATFGCTSTRTARSLTRQANQKPSKSTCVTGTAFSLIQRATGSSQALRRRSSEQPDRSATLTHGRHSAGAVDRTPHQADAGLLLRWRLDLRTTPRQAVSTRPVHRSGNGLSALLSWPCASTTPGWLAVDRLRGRRRPGVTGPFVSLSWSRSPVWQRRHQRLITR